MDFNNLTIEELNDFFDNNLIDKYFDDLNDLKKFVINNPINKKTLKSRFFELSIINIINKFEIDDQDFKEDLLEIKSLSQYAGFDYPQNTCPLIDKTKDNLESQKDDIKNDITEFENTILEIEENLEDPECYFNDEIEDLNNQIGDLSDQLSEIESDLENAEELRDSCTNVRETIVNNHADIKKDIQLFKLNNNEEEFYIIDIPEISSDYMMENLDSVFNEPNFYTDDFDDAIKNLNDIYKMGKDVSEYLEDNLKEDLTRFSYIIEKSEFIEAYINELIQLKY